MSKFEQLVSEQIEIMDQLLGLQAELQKYIDLEKVSLEQQDQKHLNEVQMKVKHTKKKLQDVQKTFEEKTEEVIQSYHEPEIPYCV